MEKLKKLNLIYESLTKLIQSNKFRDGKIKYKK